MENHRPRNPSNILRSLAAVAAFWPSADATTPPLRKPSHLTAAVDSDAVQLEISVARTGCSPVLGIAMPRRVTYNKNA